MPYIYKELVLYIWVFDILYGFYIYIKLMHRCKNLGLTLFNDIYIGLKYYIDMGSMFYIYRFDTIYIYGVDNVYICDISLPHVEKEI